MESEISYSPEQKRTALTKKEKREIGNRVAQKRIEKKYSQEKFAEALGMTRTAIGKIERGETMPKADTLLAITELLGISSDWILKGDRVPNNAGTHNDIEAQDLLVLLAKMNRLSQADRAVVISTLNTLCDGLIRK